MNSEKNSEIQMEMFSYPAFCLIFCLIVCKDDPFAKILKNKTICANCIKPETV